MLLTLSYRFKSDTSDLVGTVEVTFMSLKSIYSILDSYLFPLVSSKVEGGIRTVVVTRPVNSTSYSLPARPGPLDIITAVGWPGGGWSLAVQWCAMW